jgi:membrane-bound lytic murein transglycosylase D
MSEKKSVLLLIFLVLQLFSLTSPIQASPNNIPEAFELEVKLRMRQMTCIVQPRLNDEVRFYLGKYIFKHPEFTGRMLGKSALYFPIFEKLLKEKNMPSELKALSILESWLDPAATSRVGAGGLWQLMPQTAKMYGLTVDRQVDERRDLYRSTEAALSLLARLFEIYGDWGLSLAAYNAGPLRVNNAIKKAGVENPNFWSIVPFLPKETQHFVPKFIAFTYLINYYSEHGIYPDFPDLDLQFVDAVRIHQKISFKEIESVTGISSGILKALNPGYRNGLIPASSKGHNVVLPQRVMAKFMEYVHLQDQSEKKQYLDGVAILSANQGAESERVKYVETSYIVKKGEDLDFVAYRFHINKLRIMIWNHLSSEDLKEHQELKLFVPLEVFIDHLLSNSDPLECVQGMSPDEFFQFPDSCLVKPILPVAIPVTDSRNMEMNRHTVKLGESWMDIAMHYGIANIDTLLQLNTNKELIPGRTIIVPVELGETSHNSYISKR